MTMGPSSERFCAYGVRSAPRTFKMVGMIRRRHRPVPDDGPTGPAPPRIGAAVGGVLLGRLVAVAVDAVGGCLAKRSVAPSQAEDTPRQVVEVNGRLVQTQLDDGILKR